MPALRPYGPHSLTRAGQVSIPKEVRRRVGLDIGSEVYFAEDPRVPGLLVVIPLNRLRTWLASESNTKLKRSKPSEG